MVTQEGLSRSWVDRAATSPGRRKPVYGFSKMFCGKPVVDPGRLGALMPGDLLGLEDVRAGVDQLGQAGVPQLVRHERETEPEPRHPALKNMVHRFERQRFARRVAAHGLVWPLPRDDESQFPQWDNMNRNG